MPFEGQEHQAGAGPRVAVSNPEFLGSEDLAQARRVVLLFQKAQFVGELVGAEQRRLPRLGFAEHNAPPSSPTSLRTTFPPRLYSYMNWSALDWPTTHKASPLSADSSSKQPFSGSSIKLG